jgi:hypothetical protein
MNIPSLWSSRLIHWFKKPEPIALDALKTNTFGLLVLTGIVNPFGPTLSGLTLLSAASPQSSFVVRFYLNPFKQSAERVAQFDATPPRKRLVEELIKHVERLGYDGTGCFTLPNRGDRFMDAQAHRALVDALLARTEVVVRKLRFLKRFPSNPWDRLSAEMAEATDIRPSGSRDNEARKPTQTELAEFIDIVSREGHRAEEEKAFFAAWEGAITHHPDAGALDSLMEFETMLEFYALLTHVDEIFALRNAQDRQSYH